MKMWRTLLAIALAICLALPAWGANTVTTAPGRITIVPDGSSDWSAATSFPYGMKITGVHFKGAAGDRMVLKHESTSGSVVINLTDLLGGGVYWPVTNSDVGFIPVLDASDCTFAIAANVTIIIEFKP